MSGARGRERLQPSLLDRLTDQAPGQIRESHDQMTLSTQQLRQAVLRDLSALLNTTNLETVADLAAAPMAARSTLNFGIPAFAGMIDASGRLTALERQLADAVRAFEPRIRPQSLRVNARGADQNDTAHVIVFEIEGELWAQPVPVKLFLETAIEVETRLAVVREKAAR